MAGFDGAGNYVLRYNFQTDAAAGIKILAVRQDQQWQDMATAFGNCLTRDGQGKPANDLDWNAKRITNLGAGTSATDAAQLQQVQAVAVRGGGSANLIANPNFVIWQRGASVSAGAAGGYCADHWYIRRATAAGSTIAVAQEADSGNPFGFGLSFGRTAGDVNTDTAELRSVIETVDARRLTGAQNNLTGVVTILSCYLRAGTTLPTSTINLEIFSNATEDAGPWNASWTGEALAVISSGSLSTTAYTRVQVVLTADFTHLQTVMVALTLANTEGTAGADSKLYVTGMKIEQQVGDSLSMATPFEPNSYEVDLSRCMRYYQKIGGDASNTMSYTGRLNSGDTFDNTIVLNPPMFGVPVATVAGTWAVLRFAGNPTIVTGNNNTVILRNTCNSTGAVAMLAGTTAEYLTFESELTA